MKKIEKRSQGTQTTLRYVASTEDEYQKLDDKTQLMPFNDVVTDPNGSSNGAGIVINIPGRYEISVTTACVKGKAKFYQFRIFSKNTWKID